MNPQVNAGGRISRPLQASSRPRIYSSGRCAPDTPSMRPVTNVRYADVPETTHRSRMSCPEWPMGSLLARKPGTASAKATM
jgi:hypothetical protein